MPLCYLNTHFSFHKKKVSCATVSTLIKIPWKKLAILLKIGYWMQQVDPVNSVET